MTYDVARQRIVIFGGSSSAGYLNETWEWDGTNWTHRVPPASPPARNNHALAYDAARQRVVLFGGYSSASSSILRDTWEWDGTTWLQRTPVTSPPAHDYHAMAFDPVRQRVVLFAGRTPTSNVNADTWEWDGTTWTERVPLNSPPVRNSPAMTWDALRQRIVVFSGRDSSASGYLSDTWEWDGITWTQRTPMASPPGRSNHALAYDGNRQQVLVFGGLGGSGVYFSDTWQLVP